MTFDDYYLAIAGYNERCNRTQSLDELFYKLADYDRDLATRAWAHANKRHGHYVSDFDEKTCPTRSRPVTREAAWFGYLSAHWPVSA